MFVVDPRNNEKIEKTTDRKEQSCALLLEFIWNNESKEVTMNVTVKTVVIDKNSFTTTAALV